MSLQAASRGSGGHFISAPSLSSTYVCGAISSYHSVKRWRGSIFDRGFTPASIASMPLQMGRVIPSLANLSASSLPAIFMCPVTRWV